MKIYDSKDVEYIREKVENLPTLIQKPENEKKTFAADQ